MAELTEKQQAFVQHYVICLNATEAAERAGYGGSRATLAVTGHENLRNPKIRAAIDEAMAAVAMPKAEILGRLAAHARGDLGDFLTVSGNTVRLDLKRAKAEGLTALLKRYSRTKDGTVTIELYDAQAALVKLGETFGMFRQTIDLELEKELDAALDKLRDGLAPEVYAQVLAALARDEG